MTSKWNLSILNIIIMNYYKYYYEELRSKKGTVKEKKEYEIKKLRKNKY